MKTRKRFAVLRHTRFCFQSNEHIAYRCAVQYGKRIKSRFFIEIENDPVMDAILLKSCNYAITPRAEDQIKILLSILFEIAEFVIDPKRDLTCGDVFAQ